MLKKEITRVEAARAMIISVLAFSLGLVIILMIDLLLMLLDSKNPTALQKSLAQKRYLLSLLNRVLKVKISQMWALLIK